MLIDLGAGDRDLTGLRETLRSDVCIVGGGIAGLLLAERLSQDVTVTVLEAGGQERAGDGAGDPFQAQLTGVPHAGTAVGRVRALGGCSLTWGGQLLALPEDAAWPISLATLRAQDSPWGRTDETVGLLTAHGMPVPELLQRFGEFTPRLSRFVPFSGRNLARQPGRRLLASDRVKVVLHATVTEVVVAEGGDRVVAVDIITPARAKLRCLANHFVLAAGTVETCRLLLASRSVLPEGIGNGMGQVGRNFQDHLTVSAAALTGTARKRVLAELRPWVLPARARERAVYSLKLEPSAKLRAELGLHRSMVHVTIEEPATSGVGRLRDLLRLRQGSTGGGILAAWRTLPRAAGQLLRLYWEARRWRRRYVSPEATVRLQLNMAQDAPAASTVSLSPEVDRLGLRKAVVDWKVSPAELASLRRLAQYLREQMELAGLADGAVWEPSLLVEGPGNDEALLACLDDARHAMGGACMGHNARTSVVDPDLRVHGIANLWVASAAVFPDGAAQLPTLTLGALCVRLAARLKGEMGR